MEISSLNIVLLVQAHGSIAGAARILNLDPSSVSRTVASVESELGIRLFHRTTRRLTVTDEGQIYLRRLGPLLEEMEAAREDALGLRNRPAGLLRMTASVAFSHQMIVPLLPEFQRRFPDIVVDLESNDANIDLVEHGIDLAIRLAPAPKGDLVSTRLVGTQYRAVASPEYLKNRGHTLDPHELDKHNCIQFALPGLTNSWRFRKEGGEPFAVPVHGNLVTPNALVIHRAARMGIGVAMLADWLIGSDIREERLVALFPDYQCALSEFETSAWALYPARTYLPQKVRVMIDFLRSHLG